VEGKCIPVPLERAAKVEVLDEMLGSHTAWVVVIMWGEGLGFVEPEGIFSCKLVAKRKTKGRSSGVSREEGYRFPLRNGRACYPQ